jgi:hypothetical protein
MGAVARARRAEPDGSRFRQHRDLRGHGIDRPGGRDRARRCAVSRDLDLPAVCRGYAGKCRRRLRGAGAPRGRSGRGADGRRQYAAGHGAGGGGPDRDDGGTAPAAADQGFDLVPRSAHAGCGREPGGWRLRRAARRRGAPDRVFAPSGRHGGTGALPAQRHRRQAESRRGVAARSLLLGGIPDHPHGNAAGDAVRADDP